MFMVARTGGDLMKKLDSASITLKVVTNCETAAETASAAAGVINEFLLQVGRSFIRRLCLSHMLMMLLRSVVFVNVTNPTLFSLKTYIFQKSF